MKPNVLLVVLPYMVRDIDTNSPKIRSYLAFPYGVLSLASYCKDVANIKVMDCNLYGDNFTWRLIQELNKTDYDIVGFSQMFDNSYQHLAKLSSVVKSKNPDTIVIVGGASASYSYKEVLNDCHVDAVCYGEGEYALRGLITCGTMVFDYTPWLTRKTIDREPEGELIKNLDTVIDIDYSFVNPSDYEMREAFSPFSRNQGKSKQFFICTSRGCFGKCRFCNNGLLHGKKIRYASVDRIINHVRYLVNNYGTEVLTIYDDQLLVNKKRAKDLFRQLAQFNLRIECPNGLSVAFIDDELAGLMRAAGMDTIYLAIESGSERVLRDIIHKPLKLHQIKPVVDILKSHGFYTHGFFVIGMPGETDEDRDETVMFIKEIGLDWAGFNAATPVVGSELYKQCVENGWINDVKLGEMVDKQYIINAPELGLGPDKITKKIYEMNLDCNFVNNQRVKESDFRTAISAFQNILVRYPEHAFAHYYLGECFDIIQEFGLSDKHYEKAFDIFQSDGSWRDWAVHFGLVKEG